MDEAICWDVGAKVLVVGLRVELRSSMRTAMSVGRDMSILCCYQE